MNPNYPSPKSLTDFKMPLHIKVGEDRVEGQLEYGGRTILYKSFSEYLKWLFWLNEVENTGSECEHVYLRISSRKYR